MNHEHVSENGKPKAVLAWRKIDCNGLRVDAHGDNELMNIV